MAIGEIFLHVGMHKTGTSSIQRTFDGYDDGQIAYADLKITGNMTPNHGVALETLFRPDFENIPHHQRHGRARRVVAGYRTQFAARLDAQLALPRARLILSGEAVPRLTEEQLIPLRDRLLQATDKTTILVYIRDPQGFCASMFQQRCKSATFMAPGRMPTPQYRRKFKKFRKVFGAKNVQFVHYDRNTLVGGSSVSDFASRVGITKIPEQRSVNEGLSGDATRCLYLLGIQDDIDFDRLENKLALSRLLGPLQQALAGPRFSLPAAAVAQHVKQADVDWINATTGFDLALPQANETVDLDAVLREISAEGVQSLRQLARDLHCPSPPDAQASTIIRGLFDHFHAGTGLRARLKQGFDTVASVAGRILPAKGGLNG